MRIAFVVALFAALLAALGGAACKDEEKAPPPKAGMAGLEGEAPPDEPAAQPEAPKAKAELTTRKEGEQTVLVATAYAPAPANTEKEEAQRLATQTARILALQELLKALEKRREKKLAGFEIPALLRTMKQTSAGQAPGKGMKVVLEVRLPEKGGAEKAGAGPARKKGD